MTHHLMVDPTVELSGEVGLLGVFFIWLLRSNLSTQPSCSDSDSSMPSSEIQIQVESWTVENDPVTGKEIVKFDTSFGLDDVQASREYRYHEFYDFMKQLKKTKDLHLIKPAFPGRWPFNSLFGQSKTHFLEVRMEKLDKFMKAVVAADLSPQGHATLNQFLRISDHANPAHQLATISHYPIVREDLSENVNEPEPEGGFPVGGHVGTDEEEERGIAHSPFLKKMMQDEEESRDL